MFSSVERRSRTVRSDGVIAHPVRVGITSGTDARVIPDTFETRACRSINGCSLLCRVHGSQVTSRRRSTLWAPLGPLKDSEDAEERTETPPEVEVGALPGGLSCLAGRMLAPEFFRVFARSAKVTDLEEEESELPLLAFLMLIGTKLLDSA